jgi:hypothetical protein
LGEWFKELAMEYKEQLDKKGLVAEVKPSDNNED